MSRYGAWRITKDHRGRYTAERYEVPFLVACGPLWNPRKSFASEGEARLWVAEKRRKERIEVVAEWEP